MNTAAQRLVRLTRAYVLRGAGSRLYAVGDSHSTTLSHYEGVQVLHLKHVTAFRAGRSGELSNLLVDKVGTLPRWASPILVRVIIRPRDAVLLFFGEIDVRAHFANRWAEYGSAEELARFLAQRLAAEGRSLESKTGARVGIASVSPPSDIVSSVDFPTRGTIGERVGWTRSLNGELASACRRFGIAFVDTYADYVDPAGQLSMEVSDGTVHVRQDAAAALIEECRRHFPGARIPKR